MKNKMNLPKPPPMPKKVRGAKLPPLETTAHTPILFEDIVIFIIILIGIVLCIIGFMNIANATPCAKGTNRIIKVIDGDTFDAEIEENRFLTTALKTKRIRLLGIDAYDKRSKIMINKQAVRTGYSKERVKNFGILATNYAVDMLLGNCVMLESDYRDKGSYGRLLRYIEINNMDFGTLLLERGLANVYCNDKKISRYNEYNELSEFKCKKINNKKKGTK